MSAREVAGAVADVVAASPRFLVAPLLRSEHLRWGATDEEVAARMPGDEIVPRASFSATRAITIGAAPADVWPWLVQLGFGRAGWYSYDLFDNAARPSARRLLPEFQHPSVGDWVPMSSKVNETTAFKIRDLEPSQLLLWAKPRSTWAWTLRPLDGGRMTRLVTRLRQDSGLRLARLARDDLAHAAPLRAGRLPDDAEASPRREGARRRPRGRRHGAKLTGPARRRGTNFAERARERYSRYAPSGGGDSVLRVGGRVTSGVRRLRWRRRRHEPERSARCHGRPSLRPVRLLRLPRRARKGGVSKDVPALKDVGSEFSVAQLSTIINHGLGESENPQKPYMPVWGPVISHSQVTSSSIYRRGFPR